MNIKSTINPNPKMQLTAGTVIMGWDGLPNERIWDVRNRLVGINGFTLTSNLTCNPVVPSFKYDALGRRRRRRIEKTGLPAFVWMLFRLDNHIKGCCRAAWI